MVKENRNTILIVEDEADLRFVILAHLRAAGFNTLEASNGQEGIEMAIEHQPDLVIMDVGLPILDGVAATKLLKGNPETSRIPVLMLTGRSGAEDVVRGLEAGAQEYLAKPFDLTELLARVQSVHKLACAHRDLDHLNAQLEVEVDSKTQRIQCLYEVMRDLNQASSHDRVLDLVIDCAERLTGASRLSLLLREPMSDRLSCSRAIGIDPAVVQSISISDGEGIAGEVLRRGATFSASVSGTGAMDARGYDSKNFVSTPLVSSASGGEDGIIGVLNVTGRSDEKPYTEEEIDCLQSLASAAAIALENFDRRDQLEQSVRVLLQTVGHLAEYRDEETTQHLSRVSRMAGLLATEAQTEGPYASVITNDFIDQLVQAAPLHDIGKVGVPDEILTKPGKLTDAEFEIMKTHTEIGRRVLSQALDPAHPAPILEMCVDIASSHHERFNGKGYPNGLSGDIIPLSARMIALVDAYDAITSERRYSPAKPHDVAVEIIRDEAGAHFDPALVDAFMRCHQQFAFLRERLTGAESTQIALAV